MSAATSGIAGLSPRKQELLRRHLAARRAAPEREETIRPRRDPAGPSPLAFAQQRLWLLDRLQPGSAAYNVYEGLRLRGRLDHRALAAALAEVVRRHHVLRATFELSDDGPVQRIAPFLGVSLPVADLAALAPAAADGELRRVAEREARRPFDLARGPLHRVVLLRLGGTEHALLLALHHIVSDAASMEILFAELRVLYRCFAAGLPSPLAELPIQYPDYAGWQREWLRGERLERQLAYWRERLANAPSALSLPIDRPRSAALTHAGARHPFELAPRRLAPLRELAQREGATLFMALLAAVGALFHRTTGQDDLLIGSPIANRGRPELEPLIGLFVDTVVLRLELGRPLTFRSLLGGVRETTLGAFSHAELPFERIVEEARLGRDGHAPALQVLFALLAAAPQARELALGLAVERLPIDNRSAKFELEISLQTTAERLFGSIDYSTDLFDAATVARLAGHLARLVESAAAQPDAPLAALSWLAAAERHQLLREWNDTAVRYPAGGGLHELIAERARAAPDAIAVESGEIQLSYRELVRRAHGLAARLRALGAGPESRVGIAAERSAEMVVGLLAILAAGAAYVPLDPDYPAERLAYMLEDAGIEILLAQGRLGARLPPGHGGARAVLDLDGIERLAVPVDPGCDLRCAPESPAYAIYTSGSTGRPKGAVLSHRGIVNRLAWMQDAYRLGTADRVLQKTPFSFDVSVWEFFWPLLANARLVMAPPAAHQSPARLADLIADHGITTLHFVPAMLHAFLEEPELAVACASVRRVFASGEALPFELQQRFFARLPGVELHNLYGPTEASVDVTFHACRAEGPRRVVPIGLPIANTTIHVLDAELEPAPIGVPGELLIGGVGLARGYLGRAELTAERFVPDPFAAAPGERLYRTGDLVRRLPEGAIDFLGRLDHQVKIRGFRIEPGEVEILLARHPAVAAALVVPRVEGSGELLLAAYVVAAAGESALEVTELRAYLAAELPAYMVPAAFVFLPELPRTASGKLSRSALPAAAPLRARPREPVAHPRDLLEAGLVTLWEELLGIRPVGIHDDFFVLGGHSLQAVRLMARIERRFALRLPDAQLFQDATVAALARTLRRQGAGVAPRSPLVEIQPGEAGRRALFLVHPAGGNVLCYLPLARCLGREQPVYGLQDPSVYEAGEPRFSVAARAALYVEGLRGVQARGPFLIGGWSLGGAVAQEMARQLEEEGEVADLLLIDARSPVAAAGDADEDQLLLWFAAQLRVQVSAAELAAEPAELRFPLVLERCVRLGRLPADIEPGEARRIFDIYRAEIDGLARHVPRPCLAPTLLLRAAAGVEEERGEDSTLGWRQLTGGIELVVVPGAHQTLLDEPHVHALAAAIRERFAAAPGIEEGR